MTASSPSPLDPLAPAPQPKPAAQASPTVAQGANAAPAKKGSAGLLLGVAGGLILLLIGGGVMALFLLPKSEVAPVAASQPMPPDPGAPPAIPPFILSTSQSSTSNAADAMIKPDDLQDALKTLGPKLLVGAGETSAPRELIVRGGSAGDAMLVIPHHERWELSFPVGTTIETYSRQLDNYKIELGVIGGASTISYLSNLATPKPRVRTAPAGSDSRIYLIWNRGPLREVDDILVARAGLAPAGKVLAHFIPAETEAEMLRVEASAAQANKLSRVRKTVFTIQTVGPDQFRLAVSEQKGD